MYLTEDELILVLVQALVKAKNLKSGLNKNESPRIHVAIQGVRRQKEPVVVFSHDEASDEHKKLAQLKSSVAVKHSSDSLAMTSHGVGHVLATKKGLVPTTSHAGGVPLYKQGTLVGSVGISGDIPEVDEAIAHAAAENFAAPSAIRSDTVLRIPFHSGAVVEEREVEFLPNLDSMSSTAPLSSLSLSPMAKTGTPKTPRTSLPVLRSESPSTGSLPPLPSSVSMATLPPLPVFSSPPTPSSLPPLNSVLNSAPSSPLSTPKRSPLPPLKTSPLPSLSSLRSNSSLSSLAPSGFTGGSKTKLPLLPPSPQAFKTSSSLPPISSLSKLTPLK